MSSYMKCISVTSRCANMYRSEKLSPHGLNGCNYTYIINICRNPGITQDKLAKLIYTNKSNVTRQLASLEQEGFITRQTDERDKRATLVYPTDKAQAIFPIVLDVLHSWNDMLTEDFTDEEKACLTNLLERVMNKAKNYIDTDGGLH